SRSIALPQLGYTKAVRVCNDCFEVAYLVAYCLSDDLGPSTQTHGARGLYEIVDTNDEKAIRSILDHGGLDAMVYLCSAVHGLELHRLATASLASLAEHQPIQATIVSKRTMPKLFHLVAIYAQNISSPPRPLSPPAMLTRMASTMSVHTKAIHRVESVAAVLMNVTHIVSQMVTDKLLAQQLVREGAMDGLMWLCIYFPAGVRTRAMEEALSTMASGRNRSEHAHYENASTSTNSSARTSGTRSESDDLQQPTPRHSVSMEMDDNEGTLISMDSMFHVRLETMQGLAARCISILATNVLNQAFIVDDLERIDRLVQLLYSNNADVVKYASKTMAYLSLRNDRYKPDIVKGAGAAALLAVIQSATTLRIPGLREDNATSTGAELPQHTIDPMVLSEAVSHACCALANLATNTESQEILMSHMDLVSAICSVVGRFPHQRDIERHVARLLANLALYDQNKLALLTAYTPVPEHMSVDSRPPSRTHQHSSPLPLTRRAKGNIIPTLLFIGALTLQKAGASGVEVERPYPQIAQDAVDFMNDEALEAEHLAHGYATPNDSVSDTNVSISSHHRYDEGEGQDEGEVEWTTAPGMEDVQRHIIRAIDNLMTSVLEDPTSNQSYKVFNRISPTLGLIKTIQMANQDEDTQRRASHVLSTLVQQQLIHAETIAALEHSKQEQQQQHQSIPVAQPEASPLTKQVRMEDVNAQEEETGEDHMSQDNDASLSVEKVDTPVKEEVDEQEHESKVEEAPVEDIEQNSTLEEPIDVTPSPEEEDHVQDVEPSKEETEEPVLQQLDTATAIEATDDNNPNADQGSVKDSTGTLDIPVEQEPVQESIHEHSQEQVQVESQEPSQEPEESVKDDQDVIAPTGEIDSREGPTESKQQQEEEANPSSP
ncbi:hypothetical protein BGW38_005368, partial [Lunasporangiospora selenospora]